MSWLPTGGMLSGEMWGHRHRWIIALLWMQAVALTAAALVRGASPTAAAVEFWLIAAFAVAAQLLRSFRRVSTAIASIGLLTCCALLVHIFDGRTEMHFAYFVMVGIVTLYQDWVPLLVSIGYVLVQPGIAGLIDPAVSYHQSVGIERPWLWAAVHAGFVLAMGAVGIVSWGMNERFQARVLEREARLAETLSQLTATLDSTADGIIVISTAGIVTTFNERFTRMFGIEDEVTTPVHRDALMPEILGRMKDPQAFMQRILEAEANEDGRFEDVLELVDGRIVERCSMPQRVDGQIVGRVWSIRDITERTQLEKALSHQAFHDSLTNLANKALFRDRVTHALSRSARDSRGVAVLFVDLDDFKTVNDGLGHTVGDDLLVEVAARFRECLRDSDTAARLGGDEFAVLIEDVADGNTAEVVARQLLRTLRSPFSLGRREVYVRASIGVAHGGRGDTCDQLLRDADLAMYSAKRRGKNRYEIFEAGAQIEALDRLDLESALRKALERDEITVHYQPIVDLATGAIVGAEALARWFSLEKGAISPSTFVPLAEEMGLIAELGTKVLLAACSEVRRWQLERLVCDDFTISVNVSTRQLLDGDLLDHVMLALDGSGLRPSNLVLEITETALMRDTERSVRALGALRALGVRVALDDFGTGYSSLSYLQQFPVDILKIDQSFVAAIEIGRADTSLAPAIVSLAANLHLRVVAEGVETEFQATTLRRLGCHLAQGFYFTRPVDPTAMRAVLAERTSSSLAIR